MAGSSTDLFLVKFTFQSFLEESEETKSVGSIDICGPYGCADNDVIVLGYGAIIALRQVLRDHIVRMRAKL
jgi:hypothetical protein